MSNTVAGVDWSAASGDLVDNSDFYDNTDTVLNGGLAGTCILTDPEFISIVAPYNFGLNVYSGALRTDDGADDMGPHGRTIIIAEDDIVINGFFIDGQNLANNGIIIIAATDFTGFELKWCNVYNYQGIAIDLYDDGADLDSIISNCKINDNSIGIKFWYGNNSITESIIYNNTIYGLHLNQSVYTINHCVFSRNKYGIYIESTGGGVLIKNSIFSENISFGIFSEVGTTLIFCCLSGDTFNSNVNKSSITNIEDLPLFINTDSGDENFHIKTTEGRFVHDSPCKDASNEDPVQDIGAYNVARSVTNETRKKFQLDSNPMIVDPYSKIKKPVSRDNIQGSLKRYAAARKRIFPMQYAEDDFQTQEQIEALEFMAFLIPGINGMTESETEILLHILPAQKLETGTSATIDNTEKTLDDNTKTWGRDKFKGYWLGVKFTSGVDLVIDAAAKTGTKAGAGWTVDEWVGYYFYHNFNYYRILSNTATELTFSDADGTLEDETASTYAIEKYFEILTNSINQILLYYPDDELPDGSYDYYIDFIKVQSLMNDFRPKQDSGFFYQKYWQKTGFPIVFGEV